MIIQHFTDLYKTSFFLYSIDGAAKVECTIVWHKWIFIICSNIKLCLILNTTIITADFFIIIIIIIIIITIIKKWVSSALLGKSEITLSVRWLSQFYGYSKTELPNFAILKKFTEKWCRWWQCHIDSVQQPNCR